MIVGVDIDCVVTETVPALLQLHYEDTGERLTIDDITDYDIGKFVSPQYRQSVNALFGDSRLWDRVEILDGCTDTVKRLIDKGYEIYFVTSAGFENMVMELPVLEKAFPFMDVRRRIITTYNKHIIDVDILIDDCADNLIGINGYGILFDYPWNRNIDMDKNQNIFRVCGWQDVFETVQFLERWREWERSSKIEQSAKLNHLIDK